MTEIETVDCHSHTCLRREYYDSVPHDLFELTGQSYFGRDIQATTGKNADRIYDGASSDEEKWQILKGILARTRNVSYWRHHIAVHQGLFGLEDDDLEDSNWQAVNEKLKSSSKDPNWYEHVTRDVCNLTTQVRNIPWFEDWEPEYFTATLRMEQALVLYTKDSLASFESHMGRSFSDIVSLKQGLADLVEEYRQKGSVGIKLAHAYRRTLASDDVPEETAGKAFSRARSGEKLSAVEMKQFEDHIIFYLARIAGEMNQVFQIHTGDQGNWGHVPDSNPLHLLPLLHANKNTRFDLFHAGYPYSREMGMLGKHTPNVWLNMCWMYLVTMEGSRQSLSEWIDLVPGYRLLGFGSDVRWPEMIYGHLVMARSCIADVLAAKVEQDFLSEAAAFDLVRMMLHDNAVDLYGL